MQIQRYNRPVFYYLISVLVPWTLWFIMAYLSYSPLWDNMGWKIFGTMLGLLGLMTPMLAAFYLILPNKAMRDELFSACFSFRGIGLRWWVFTFLMPVITLLTATAISIPFGGSLDQFHIVKEISFGSSTSIGIAPAWFVIFIAPILEELGWSSYGLHCIRQKHSILGVCLIFGLIWGLWHMPLSFIKGSYQNDVAQTGVLYSINFLVSLVPYLILDTWRFYKTRRNMFLNIMFHYTMNFTAEIFCTEANTKVIWTLVLLVYCGFIVLKDRKFFFSKEFDD